MDTTKFHPLDGSSIHIDLEDLSFVGDVETDFVCTEPQLGPEPEDNLYKITKVFEKFSDNSPIIPTTSSNEDPATVQATISNEDPATVQATISNKDPATVQATSRALINQSIKQSTPAKKRPDTNSKYKCQTCSFSTRFKFSLRRHMTTHNNAMKTMCNACDKVFAEPYDLQEHEKIVHKEMPLICQSCGKTYKSRSGMYDHMRKEHTNTPRYICNYCSKTYMNKHMFNAHVAGHANIKLFNCTLCKKTFKYKHSLVEHEKMCADKTHGHECSVCGKKFKRKNFLTDHIWIPNMLENCMSVPVEKALNGDLT